MIERWGMVVDLNRCVGCQTCTAACKHANDTVPGVQWRSVLDVEVGRYPDVERLFLVVGCQHCAEPPCVPVCPTGATRQRDDGLVTMDYDLCIGCASCAVACPYQARTIVHDKRWYFGRETVQEAAVAHDERLGVAQKCTFCIEKIDTAQQTGEVPGVDLDVTPACAASCIAQAIHFGDFNDADSNISRLARDNKNFRMHEELGTEPQIRYLYETPAVPGRNPAAGDDDDQTMSDPANALVGPRQPWWDIRAAMNFILGGFGAGFAIMAFAAHLMGAVSTQFLPYLYAGAGAIMGVGLFFVFLKLGRKLRFLNVLLRPQSSWMTRETYAVAALYPLMLADLLAPGLILHALVALFAAVFLYCQARILHAGKGIPAWRVPLMTWMLVATGLLEGAALLALAHGFAPGDAMALGPALPAAGVVLVLLNAAFWQIYRAGARHHGIGPLARRVLARLTPPLHLVGHAVPLAVFAALLAGVSLPVWALPLAAAAAFAGGAWWKGGVILFAGYQQGYALAKMPHRGSGARAAPTLAEPEPASIPKSSVAALEPAE